MITPLALLFALAPLGLPAAPSPSVSIQETAAAPAPARLLQDDEEEEKPDKREEIKVAVKELKGYVGARGKEDTQALAVIDTLLQEFPESGPKDRKDIVKALSGCMKQKRKPNKEGVFDNKLHIAAATALGRMGPESVKDLVSWVDHKSFSKDFQAKRAIILALGNTKDEDAVDPLIDLITHHAPEVQAAAAEALGGFTELEEKGRKHVFKKVLDELMRVKNNLDVNPTDPIVRERYDAIAGPMLTTLREISGHDTGDPGEYRSWWNDNKKKDWDEGKEG